MMTSTYYSKSYVGWPPVHIQEYSDPNSSHWQRQARDAQHKLNEMMGDADYETWAEITWPGNTVDDKSWQELWQDANGAISLGEDALFQELECTCNPAEIGTRCKVCEAKERLSK